MIDVEILTIGEIVIALISGMVVSGIYFGTLWLTVRRLARQRHPAIIVLLSLVVRLALLLIVFYLFVDGGHWERLLIVVIGFVAMRTALIRKNFVTVRPS